MSVTRNTDFEQRLSGILAPEFALFPVRWFTQISSTMDGAKEWLEQNNNELRAEIPGLVMADYQSAGRGRQGRTWHSATVGFYGTYILALRNGVQPQNLPSFSLVVGCVIQNFLKGLGAELRLKWPNDIVTPAGRKLAGVLLELYNTKCGSYVLVGIGINLEPVPVAQASAVPLSVSWAELSGGAKLSPLEIASEITPRLLQGWRRFESSGFESFKPLWESAAIGMLRTFKIDTGQEVLEGQMVGISGSGALLLRVENEVKEIVSGHILSI